MSHQKWPKSCCSCLKFKMYIGACLSNLIYTIIQKCYCVFSNTICFCSYTPSRHPSSVMMHHQKCEENQTMCKVLLRHKNPFGMKKKTKMCKKQFFPLAGQIKSKWDFKRFFFLILKQWTTFTKELKWNRKKWSPILLMLVYEQF